MITLIVGYKVRAVDDQAKTGLPPDCIRRQPYTSVLDEVVVSWAARDKNWYWVSRPGDPGRPTAAVSVRNFLCSTFEDLKPNRLAVVAFDPVFFMDLVAFECSYPSVGKTLPPVYRKNIVLVDIGEAVKPSRYANLTWDAVLRARRPAQGEDAKKWDANAAGWSCPGESAGKDLWFATEFGARSGLLEVKRAPARE
jgi:hypothetical protein